MPVEGRDLNSIQTQDVGKDRKLGNPATPKSVQRLQKVLHAKAKTAPGFRFYAKYFRKKRVETSAATVCMDFILYGGKVPVSRYQHLNV